MKAKEFKEYLIEIEEMDNLKDIFLGIFSTTTQINNKSYKECTEKQLIESLAVLYLRYGELKYLSQSEIEQLQNKVWGETEEEQQWLRELFAEVVEFVREQKYGPCIEL
jgi:methionine salvage enolase-phosphatase E1